jgi:large subunit ribosomal protein L3
MEPQMKKVLSLLAKKMGMTQIFVDEGVRIAVTVLKVEPNVVISKRTKEKDGYTAVQIGFGDIREKLVNKAKAGHFAKANVKAMRHLREWRVDEKTLEGLEIGQNIDLGLLEGVTSIDVSSVSKGKGYAGVMKRHNFGGFPATHGTHETFRHGGSIGMRAQPGKVLKGKKMAGHMGVELVTTLNLRVIRVMNEEGLLLVRGAVPGGKGAVVEVKASTRSAKAIRHIGGQVVEEASKNPMKASKAGAKTAAPKKK